MLARQRWWGSHKCGDKNELSQDETGLHRLFPPLQSGQLEKWYCEKSSTDGASPTPSRSRSSLLASMPRIVPCPARALARAGPPPLGPVTASAFRVPALGN